MTSKNLLEVPDDAISSALFGALSTWIDGKDSSELRRRLLKILMETE